MLFFQYSDPTVASISPVRPLTNVQQQISIVGSNFGSQLLAVAPGLVPPHLQVFMHYACVTNVTDGSECVSGAITVASDVSISFPSTLGVGIQKTLVVAVVDGTFSQYSVPILFDHAAPDIIGLLNSPVLMTDGVTPSLAPQQPAVLQVCASKEREGQASCESYLGPRARRETLRTRETLDLPHQTRTAKPTKPTRRKRK